MFYIDKYFFFSNRYGKIVQKPIEAHLSICVTVQLGTPSKVVQTMNGGRWMPDFYFISFFPSQ